MLCLPGPQPSLRHPSAAADNLSKKKRESEVVLSEGILVVMVCIVFVCEIVKIENFGATVHPTLHLSLNPDFAVEKNEAILSSLNKISTAEQLDFSNLKD